MNYDKIYNALVEKAKVRGLDKSKVGFYTEAHHIVPVCIGGTNEASNFVLFSGREHFIAHMLLWKGHPDNVSLMRAAHIMSSRWTNDIAGNSHAGINSKVYSKLREEYSQAVSEQVSGENNPFFGKTHSEESITKMKEWHANNPDHFVRVFAEKNNIDIEKARLILLERKVNKGKYYVVDSLNNWATNNDKYMAQFNKIQSPSLPVKVEAAYPHPTLVEEEVKLKWLNFYLYKDFWERCNKPGHKDFTTKVENVLNTKLSNVYFKTLVDNFKSDWDFSKDPDWLAFVLNNSVSNDCHMQLKSKLEKTPQEISDEFFSKWLSNREENKGIIQSVINKLSIVQHPNSCKSGLTLPDVIEANILWKSGLVQKKQIAQLLKVRPNTISQSTSPNLRWKEVTSIIDSIVEEFYSRN